MIIEALLITTNTNDNFVNLVVRNKDNTIYNIKTSKKIADNLKVNHIYLFDVKVEEGNRTKYYLNKVEDVSLIEDEKRYDILKNFLNHKDINFTDLDKEISAYIKEIDNKILFDITKKLYDKYKTDLLTYPGGTRIHHSFLGGLGYHVLTMLNMAKQMIIIYPYLNKNYLYSGIILHDLGKIFEFSDVQNPEFTIDGQMLGHLVIGAMKVKEVAKELGYEDKEESLILEHIIISHHGQLQYGSARKPLTAEALLIWYLDTIDSKFQVIGDELKKIEEGSFTDSLAVLDKSRLYKPKVNNE